MSEKIRVHLDILLRDDPDLFRNPGYFAYDPTLDKSRGTDVER